MKRTKQAFLSILAAVTVTAALTPSALASGPTSVNAALNDGEVPASQGSSGTRDYRSLNATLQDGGTEVAAAGSQASGYSSPTAILADSQPLSSDRPLDSGTTTLGSPNAILGAAGQPQGNPPAMVVAAEPDGFDWGDAMIGAGGVVALTLGAATLLSLNRRRRPSDVRPPVPA